MLVTWFWYTLNKIHCDAWLANASALTTNTVHRTMFKNTMARINERNVIERKAKRRSMYGEINQQTCIMLKMPRDSVDGDLTVQTLWNWFTHSCHLPISQCFDYPNNPSAIKLLFLLHHDNGEKVDIYIYSLLIYLLLTPCLSISP